MVLAVSLLGLLALAGSAVAQAGPAQADMEARLTEIFSGFEPQEEVQIVTPRFFIEDGAFQALGPDRVAISQGGSTVDVHLQEIRSVAVRDSHPLQGALWGTGSGVLVGGIAGMMVSSFGCRTVDTCTRNEQEGAIRWAVVFGVLGGATGFVIGRHSVYWKPIFP